MAEACPTACPTSLPLARLAPQPTPFTSLDEMVIEIEAPGGDDEAQERALAQAPVTLEVTQELNNAELQPPCSTGIWQRMPWTKFKRQQKDPFGHDGRYKEFKVKPVNDYPAGYPQLAAWTNTDDNFRVYRRFGDLRNRVLQRHQFMLGKLEADLAKMDKYDSQSDEYEDNFRLASIEYDQNRDDRRTRILDEVEATLEKYDAALERERMSLSLPPPTEKDHKNVINYIWDQKAITGEEVVVFNRKDDAVILRKSRDSPFQELLESFLQEYAPDSFRKWFATSEQLEKSEDCDMLLFSKRKINMVVRAVVTIVTVYLLVMPISLLFTLNSANQVKVAVLLLFVLLFGAAISVFSRLRHYEIFAATSAYTAVLVVFLQNVSIISSDTNGA